jgi:hypothetical protein
LRDRGARSTAAGVVRGEGVVIRGLVGSQESGLELRGVGGEGGRVDDLVHELFEAALHVDAGLGAGLEEQAAVLARERDAFLLGHHAAALLEVHLVADQHLDAVAVRGEAVHFLQPHVREVRERRPARHVVHQDDPLRAPVVRAR